MHQCRKGSRERGRISCLLIPVTMLKVSQLGAGLETKQKPPPNKIMNGQGRRGLQPVDKQQGQGHWSVNKCSQCSAFLRRGSSTPGPSPGSRLPCPSSLGSLSVQRLPLPQGKVQPFVSPHFLPVWEPLRAGTSASFSGAQGGKEEGCRLQGRGLHPGLGLSSEPGENNGGAFLFPPAGSFVWAQGRQGNSFVCFGFPFFVFGLWLAPGVQESGGALAVRLSLPVRSAQMELPLTETHTVPG